MAPITPTTFNPLLRYVNVRLQQGVPLVDADWNEHEDIRKFELQAFLKWYVGDGVPFGNDGFRVDGGLDNDLWIRRGMPDAPATATPTERALGYVGRCLVDGMDVIIAGDLRYSAQPLHEDQPGAAALAARLEVPVVARLTAPAAAQTLIVYLDVWERLVKPSEEPALMLPGLGVESCARMRREWVVRAGDKFPGQPGATGALPGHRYCALAGITRAAGVAQIAATALQDIRPRALFMLPGTLVQDVFGVDLGRYRVGAGRPAISLRDAINALLRGEMPKRDFPRIHEDVATMTTGRFVLVPSRGIVGIFHDRSGALLGTRVDPGDPNQGFTKPSPVAVGTRTNPSFVALPDGQVVVAVAAPTPAGDEATVVMKRGRLEDLASAPETIVFGGSKLNFPAPLVVRANQTLVFFANDVRTNPLAWFFRRYDLVNAKFLDPSPVQVTFSAERLHAAPTLDGTGVFLAAANTNNGSLWATVLDTVTGAYSWGSALFNGRTGMGDPFVLPSGSGALIFFGDSSGIQMARFRTPGLQVEQVTTGDDLQPTAVEASDGTVWVFWARITAKAGLSGPTRLHLIRRLRGAPAWSSPQAVEMGDNFPRDSNPTCLAAPDGSVWVFWTGIADAGGQVMLRSRQIIPVI